MAPMISFRWCPMSCLVMQRRSFGPVVWCQDLGRGIVMRGFAVLASRRRVSRTWSWGSTSVSLMFGMW